MNTNFGHILCQDLASTPITPIASNTQEQPSAPN